MKYFLDTSALTKYFFEERGSDLVTQLIRTPDNQIIITELAIAELVSSAHTKFRTGQINAEQLQKTVDGYERSIESFFVEPLSTRMRKAAVRLLISHAAAFPLRTLDALQVATFLLIREADWIFVSADERLITLVQALDFPVLNPNLT